MVVGSVLLPSPRGPGFVDAVSVDDDVAAVQLGSDAKVRSPVDAGQCVKHGELSCSVVVPVYCQLNTAGCPVLPVRSCDTIRLFNFFLKYEKFYVVAA